MIGKTNAGAGGVDLYVVGGTTRPASPKNNTIWVDTDTQITGWEVGYNRPSSPQEGNVFIFTNGAASVADMEVSGVSGRAKNQTVKVTPAYAYQYISGEWVNKTAKLYVNNGWLDTMTILYDRGAYGATFAKGWSSGEQSGYVSITARTSPVTSISNGSADMTGIKTVNLEWSCSGTDSQDRHARIDILDATTLSVLRSVESEVKSSGTRVSSLDVSSFSNTVKFRLYVGNGGGTGTITLYSIKLVPGNPT